LYTVVKRLLDIIFSIILIIIFIPIWVLVPIMIRLESKGNPIFVQDRLGVNGKVFKIYKFRTMCVGAENMGSGQYSFEGDSRVTKIGHILRKTSIDELPQIFNILTGKMSFIGPRPTLTYHPMKFEEYSAEQKHRFDVRPGVTGIAQVNGRKQIDWDKRIEYDNYYVANMSLIIDIKIFCATLVSLIKMNDNENVEETTNAKESKVG